MKYLFVFLALVVVVSYGAAYPTANAAVAPTSTAHPESGPQPSWCDDCHNM